MIAAELALLFMGKQQKVYNVQIEWGQKECQENETEVFTPSNSCQGIS